jgi:hypothetical protein
MPRTQQDIIRFIQVVYGEHRNYWEDKAAELKRYKDAYETKFWASEAYDNTMIRVETADAFGYIEGFIASLFTKTPAVVIGADIASTGGDPKLAQAAANRFLYNQREQLEIASRLALIYDYAALKLIPEDSNEMLDKVSIKAVPCWEVIVDRDASSEQDSRFVGHNYYMTLVEAKQKFGSKNFIAVPKQDYFDENTGRSSLYEDSKTADLPDDYLYVEVVEVYDLLHDEVYYWSPNYSGGEKLLERAPIPIRTYNDNALPNISLLYYSRVPSKPMEGLSALSRVYDQIYEKNILRSYWANAVRRDSRQYLYKEGYFDEEQLAKVTAGIDGAMIGVDVDSLAGLIQPIAVEPISSNFDRYLAYIEQDLNRGSILAPFSKGEATKATATEITALAQYSASEIGKLAREKDSALENIVNIYIRLLDLLADEGETAVLDVEGEARVITPQDLDGKFRINALDQGSTPLSDAMRKQNLISLIPTLQGLGVGGRSILEEIVRAYELPKDFLEPPEPQPEAPTATGTPAPSAADVENIEGGVEEQVTSAELLARAITPGEGQ